MGFAVQIFMDNQWYTLLLYESDSVDRAAAYCDRALMNFKVNARIMGPDDEIVYEKFYNPQDDPDYRPSYDYGEEEEIERFDIDWREAGF